MNKHFSSFRQTLYTFSLVGSTFMATDPNLVPERLLQSFSYIRNASICFLNARLGRVWCGNFFTNSKISNLIAIKTKCNYCLQAQSLWTGSSLIFPIACRNCISPKFRAIGIPHMFWPPPWNFFLKIILECFPWIFNGHG